MSIIYARFEVAVHGIAASKQELQILAERLRDVVEEWHPNPQRDSDIDVELTETAGNE